MQTSQFEPFAENGKEGFVLRAQAALIRSALLGRGELETLSLGGRGAVRRFQIEDGHGIVREYKRGGIIRHFLDGVYLTNRPLHEFYVHCEALARGVSAPEVLGVMYVKRGIWYSGAFATRYVEGENLLAVMSKEEVTAAALAGAARATRQMHDAGIDHADLQLMNLVWDGTRAYIIDLDNARASAPVSPSRRERRLRRLKRSFDKHGFAERFTEFRDVYSSPNPAFASPDQNP